MVYRAQGTPHGQYLRLGVLDAPQQGYFGEVMTFHAGASIDKPKTLGYLEGVSALLSFAALIGAIVLGAQNPDMQLRLWKEKSRVLVLNDAIGDVEIPLEDNQASVAALATAWANVSSGECAVGPLANSTRVYEKRTVTSLQAVVDDGVTLNPWLILGFIYLMAMLFQGYRAWRAWYPAKQNATWFAYSEEGGVSILRWLEYALTSPLQILLIGWTFDVVAESAVTLLACAQLGLVLLGLPIERYIDKLYKNRIKAQFQSGNKELHVNKATQCWLSAFVYFVLAAVIHAFVWRVLLVRRNDTLDQLDCVQDQAVPGSDLKESVDSGQSIISAIFWIEFALFTCFAFVLAWTFVKACLTLKSTSEADARAVMHDSNRWNNIYYGILSVSSKLALEIGLLLLVNNNRIQ